jgi:ATP-dependent Lon protease
MLTSSSDLVAMTSRKELPTGFAYGDYVVLVPTHLTLDAPAEPIQSANLAHASAESTSENSAQANVFRARRRLRSPRTLQVYDEHDVQSLEQSVQSLSRTNERRRNLEAMLTLLRQRSPVGVRTLARVPKTFNRALDHLVQEMPNFTQVVETIRRMLALQCAGDGSFQLPPLLLAGDPGVGKTYFAMRLATLMNSGFEMISMEGATSPMALVGLEQGYYSSSPGKIFEILVQGATANPVFVVDELDKASSDARHPPANALYQLLEPQTAQRFCDQACLHVKLDASRICWVVTANDTSVIPLPLRSRLTTFHVPAPTYSQRVQIAATVYRDLRATMSWGKRFDPVLSQRTARALASAAGSVRPMKTLLRLACGTAFLRQASTVEAVDIMHALRCAESRPDLEHVEPAGNA